MKEWAENLLNRPVGVNDDYGNLIVSLGIALQQQPQEFFSPLDPKLNEDSTNASKRKSTASQSVSNPSMLVMQLTESHPR
jgi:hypothetical protein